MNVPIQRKKCKMINIFFPFSMIRVQLSNRDLTFCNFPTLIEQKILSTVKNIPNLI